VIDVDRPIPKDSTDTPKFNILKYTLTTSQLSKVP